MKSLLWTPAVALSKREERLLKFCKKAPLFVFLRKIRHELFDEPFQQKLIAAYPERTSGEAPVPPAQLAMVSILQAALRVSDQEAARLASTDRCWQMVLDSFDDEDAPFAQSTLVSFRARMIEHSLDTALFDRSVAFARTTKLFGHTALRTAFDASPLWGAGRVEDTFNLLGHAARQILRTIAAQHDEPFDKVAQEAGIPLVANSSLKAALDIDWNDKAAQHAALQTLLGQLDSLVSYAHRRCAQTIEEPPLSDQLQTLERLREQDLEPDPDPAHAGQKTIRQGVARERQISVSDPSMRHGRKSKAVRFDGYKRHVAIDLSTRLIVGVAITRGNRPESEAGEPLAAELMRQGFTVSCLYIDRGYLDSPAVTAYRRVNIPVECKAPTLRNGSLFTKADFQLDLVTGRVVCPAGQTRAMKPGVTVKFPAAVCNACSLRAKCTESEQGRSLTVHPQEAVLIQLRARQKTPEGRAELRKRVPVEHRLARIGQSQGDTARYLGERKNLYDLRRHATVSNLFIAMEEAA